MRLRAKLLGAASLLAAAALPGLALAQVPPVTGPYVSLGLGTDLMMNQHYNYAPASLGQAGHFQFRPDYAGQIGVGYGLGNGIRVEVDGDFFRNNASKSVDNFNGANPVHGGVNTYGVFLNGFYDFQTGTNFVPFIGGGVGYAYQKWQHLALPATYGDVYSGTYGSFAFDVGAGVAYNITQVPGLALTAQYSYTELTHTRKYLDAPAATVINVGHSGNNVLLVGLRYQLFPPAPPAPPAPAPAPVATPAPAPARTYLVFFDWNKYNLTPRADQIIAQAADASRTTHVTSLNVNGYTDTSGTPAYNEKLSFRRADTVAAKLVADGVPKQDIVIKGFGETHLLVPTGPGVREPQNRRVEIILH